MRLDLVYARIDDANLDGAVAVDDMVTLRRNLGASGSRAGWQNGDFDYDGRVTWRDLRLLRGNYGDRLTAAAPAAFAAVPQPGAAMTLVSLAAFPLRRRRRASAGSAAAAPFGLAPAAAGGDNGVAVR